MAKVPFSKLDVKLNTQETIRTYVNSKGETIEYSVKQYLPLKEKLTMVTDIINQSSDLNGYYNPMRVKLYMTLEVVYAYTNLNFTAKMKEDPFKLYDLLTGSGIFNDVISGMSDVEWKDVQDSVWDTINKIYEYKNSLAGVLELTTQDYSAINMDLSAIQDKLADPNSLALVKEIMPLINANMV